MQLGNRLAAAVLDRISHGKQPQHVLRVGQKNDCLALLLKCGQTGFEFVRTLAQLMNQPVIAQVIGLAVHQAFRAATGQGFKALHLAQRHAVALGRISQGA